MPSAAQRLMTDQPRQRDTTPSVLRSLSNSNSTPKQGLFLKSSNEKYGKLLTQTTNTDDKNENTVSPKLISLGTSFNPTLHLLGPSGFLGLNSGSRGIGRDYPTPVVAEKKLSLS